MIGALLGLFRREAAPEPGAAGLGDLMLVAARRRRSRGGGRPTARTKIGGHWISLYERADPAAQRGERTLDELLDELVPKLDRRSREQLFEFVSQAARPYLDGPRGLELAHRLGTLGERLVAAALPEPPPSLMEPPAVVIDAIAALDDLSFWVFGWARNVDGSSPEMTLVAPTGERVPVLPGAPRFDREDVIQSLAEAGVPERHNNGFAKLFALETPSRARVGWRAELRVPGADAYRLRAPAVTVDPGQARSTMTSLFRGSAPALETLRREHAFPALKRLQARAARDVEIERELEYGSPPGNPTVSIVVPLYRRIDLIEHQLAQFWRDPELAETELIYVLDSPEQAEDLNRLAGPLHELYGLPFKVLTLSRNGGYAVANNLGASRAGGRLLLLLNSDVLPAGPGWVGRMAAFYDATPEIGALGPKLLYEDESIQHAGMYFKRDAASRLWENQHYYKGFARTLPAAAVSRPVPAVTGACMLVERALFENLGGFSTVYVEGGYEDSDFCIRLVEAGRRNWYLADVELYHLEAQSFFIHTRLANPCNAWIQTHLWNDRIEALMSTPPESVSTPLAAVS